MTDPRVRKLASVLINYSLGIMPGDKLAIRGDAVAEPLILECYREALRAGAHPDVYVGLEELAEIRLKEGTEEQLRYVSEIQLKAVEYYDANLAFWSDRNTKALSGVDPRRMAISQEATRPLMQRMLERSARGELRWCGTLFPTNAHAQDAGMSLSEYEDFVYGAGLLDEDDPAAAWQKVRESQQHIADYLSRHDEIRIEAPDTQLTYRVGGRHWINCAGNENFPDGEVFTAPIEDSVSGTVRFTYPAVYNANEVEDVRLTFREGRVVEASAGKGEGFLLSMLDLDSGSRYVGEVAFGLNYGIGRFTRNILFDEKLGGTMHMALGKAYPESGGTNESGLHWDMICDLSEGRVYADSELCYEHGRFKV